MDIVNPMDITQIRQVWEVLQPQWWWIHSVLLGLFLGGSLGIWAYREVWYGLSTFFSSPIETHSPFRTLVQWLASLVMWLRSGIGVALILTWPLVLQHWTVPANRWIAVGLAGGVWGLLRLLLTFGKVQQPAPPTFLKNPFRWAYYRSVQTPDSLVTGWLDVILGIVLHVGLALIWYEYRNLEDPEPWWRTAAIGASVLLILLATTITVLVHPTPSSHRPA